MRSPRIIALAVTALLLAAGCGAADDGSPTGAAPGRPDPRAEVDVRLLLEPTSLDITKVAGAALEQILLGNVYEGLVKYTDDGKIEPGLAALPEVSGDGLTYTFTLNRATFHDGSPVTAADVEDSFGKVIAADSVNPAKASFASVEKVEAKDDTTVVITLARRDTTFLYALAGRGGVVLKKGAANRLDDSENGTGPFRLQNWQRGSTITFVRDDAYWGQAKAKVAKVVFHYIADENTALNALRAGEIDLYTGTTGDSYAAVQGDPGFTVTTGNSNTIFVLAFNNSRGPLKDPRVRHALRRAVDKDGLVTTLGGDHLYAKAGSHTAPTDPWYEDLTSIDSYDPAAAKALLAQAGHAAGLDLELTVPNIYPSTMADYIAAQYKAVGVNLKVNTVEFGVWLDKVYTKADYDLSLVAHVEPLTILQYAQPGYYWRYDNPDVRKWTEEAISAGSDAERDTLLGQVARKISEDAAADWVVRSLSTSIARPGVTGFPKNDTNARLDLSGLTVTTPR
ncbi:ABC transporter substrate-binding protein [Microtetraspora sp. NBRC 13810]|uniref:ABC transporter substrate-binding protein n=1 Tax=Microtetraspora sp. NBRC 13810 TaxID=3030990 RepID=UPI0024A02410|nr:ABC transporter substrate-binding protein [Microtetraspora sp. NBRC 13810]GLW10985.1 ABC transporter substrate-binding protein [Microtetraspora sp. NBRC 13810]